MRLNIVVATHHKTGTVWMASVFKALAKRLGMPFIDFWSHYGRLEKLLNAPFVLFNHDSTFLQYSDVLIRDDVRVLHLIRDPRDVLISGMHYHRISRESWLQQPASGHDGVAYQRRLTSLATPFEQYLFELDNATNRVIEDMLDWQYDRPNCLELRYEDLRLDASLVVCLQVANFLGFDEAEQSKCLDCFQRNSLFGGVAMANPRHVRSGDVAQWSHEFTPALARAFIERFPDALQVLGYEPDDHWIERLERDAEERASGPPTSDRASSLLC